MRAAAGFTQARLFVDLNGNSFHLEIWNKTGTPGWVTEGDVINLSQGVALGFGVVSAAPPNTQTTIAQAPAV